MFTLYYNQTGDSRLPFAKTVAEIIGVKPKYTGVPQYSPNHSPISRRYHIYAEQ